MISKFVICVMTILVFVVTYVSAQSDNSEAYNRLFDGEGGQALGVKVHSDGSYSVANHPVALTNVVTLVRHRVNRYGPSFPFFIDPEPGAVFSNAWPLIAKSAGQGVWKQSLIFDGTRYDYAIPARDKKVCKPGFKPINSPIILKNFSGNDSPELCCVRLIGNQVVLNRKDINLDKLEERVSSLSTNKIVVLIPSPNVPMELFSKTIKHIFESGNRNLSVFNEVEE